MGNLLDVTAEVRSKMRSTRPRVGIDHRTVVPTPPTAETDEEQPTADTDET